MYMDLYRDLILDHYRNPRNFGVLEKAECTIQEANTSCGDTISMGFIFDHKQDVLCIKDIRFNGEGCAISQASASLLTEEVKGKPVEIVLSMKLTNILEMLGTTLTPSRVKCALLPLEIIQKAILVKLGRES